MLIEKQKNELTSINLIISANKLIIGGAPNIAKQAILQKKMNNLVLLNKFLFKTNLRELDFL